MKLGLRRKKAAEPWKPTLHTSPPSGSIHPRCLYVMLRLLPDALPPDGHVQQQPEVRERASSDPSRFSLPSVPSAPSAPFLPGDHKGDCVPLTVRKAERPLRQPQVFGDGLRPTMQRHRRPPGKLAHDWDGVLSHLAISCPAREKSTSMPQR